MSTHEEQVSTHYANTALTQDIEAGLAKMGLSPASVSVEDLAVVDEFHIGGREATSRLLEQLHLSAADHVLDIGCGIGGAARYTTQAISCQVTGIDLTPEYVATGQVLNQWVGLDDQIELYHGNALQTPFADHHFSAAYMLHVGMNIADKTALFREVGRVLKPGSRLAVYDIMIVGPGNVELPVPWASAKGPQSCRYAAAYQNALKTAGYRVEAVSNRQAFALEFFAAQRARTQASSPAPLGLHTLVGESIRPKFKNMIAGVTSGHIAPVEIIAVT